MANVLGINLSEIPAALIREKIAGWLNSGGQHYLVTPNPEIILNSQKDEELFYILNHANLAIADGFGLKIAGFLNGVKIPRLTGADLTLDLLQLATDRGIKIAIINWRGGLSNRQDIDRALKEKYPKLNYLVLDTSRSRPLAPEIIARINDFSPLILFCSFGSPYQEKTIYHNLKNLPSLRLALGVGGTFDFITGLAFRAPGIFRSLGLEWLWRLIRQPGRWKHTKRWKRVYNATVVFIARLLLNKFNHFFFRPSVVCLLYKREAGEVKILIVEREVEPGCWQLPQGGTDGESLAKAGRRELQEELNTDKFLIKGTFKNIYKYFFPSVKEKELSLNNNSSIPKKYYKFGYKGQKQGLCIAEFIGRDEDIKINFWDHLAWKWVEEYDFVASLEPRRQVSARIFLEKLRSLNI